MKKLRYKCRVLENIFNNFNGDKINMEANPIERLIKLGRAKCSPAPHSIYKVQLYMRMRLFQRIKLLNDQTSMGQLKK